MSSPNGTRHKENPERIFRNVESSQDKELRKLSFRPITQNYHLVPQYLLGALLGSFQYPLDTLLGA